MRFFPTSAAAAAAGYRACRRCKPDTESLQRQHLLMIQRACQLLEETNVPLSLERIARSVGLSRFYFHRLFKRYVGITPKEYSATCQFRRLETLLERGTPIIDAIYDAGFSSTSRLYEKSDKELGMTPAKFKSGGSGLHICHAIVESPLGNLLVAMTERGACMIEFGGTSSELMDKLMARFPGAKLVCSHPEFTAVLPRIIGLLDSPQRGPHLSHSLRGTAFQRKVRKALQDIWPPRARQARSRAVRPQCAGSPGRATSPGRSPSRAKPAPSHGSATPPQSTPGANHDDQRS